MKMVVCKPDVVILATVYTQEFTFLDNTYPTTREATIHSVWKQNDETVGFIGFVRPSYSKSLLTSSFSTKLTSVRSYPNPRRDASPAVGLDLAPALAGFPQIRRSLPPQYTTD
jgi:hypothetical protein